MDIGNNSTQIKQLLFTLSILFCFLYSTVFADTKNSPILDSSPKHLNIHGDAVELSYLFPDHRNRCFFPYSKDDTQRLPASAQMLMEILNNEPSIGSYLMGRLAYQKSTICFEHRTDGTHGYYDYDYNALVILDSLNLYTQSIALMHELRHLDQVAKKYVISVEFDIDESVRLRFAVEADAHAVTTLLAWKIKVNGDARVWDALSNLEHYEDITEAFEKEIYSSGKELSAVLAAFRQWYTSAWRINEYYYSAHMGFLDLLDDTKRIRQYEKLPSNYFDDLCALPDGKNYGCHLSEEIHSQPRLIRRLAQATSN